MARPSSCAPGGFAEHAVRQGIARAPCFRGPGDCTAFLSILGLRSGAFDCRVHAYALMGNHVHLLLTAGRPGTLAQLMHALDEDYLLHLRRREAGLAAVFEPAIDVTAIHAPRHLLACMRYIELNPVRAGLVRRPEDYRWSSYRANAGDRQDALLSPHPYYLALGREPGARRTAYRRSVESMLAGGRLDSGISR